MLAARSHGRDAVKFGISYNTAVCGLDPDNMAALARHAEECGFESFYVSEHIVVYPGPRRAPWSSRLPLRSPIRWNA